MMNELIENFQEQEKLHWSLYEEFAKNGKEAKNKEILEELAKIEKVHYEELEKLTGKKIEVSKIKMKVFVIISKVLGIRFVLKYLEKKEDIIKNEIINFAQRQNQKIPKIITETNQEEELTEKLYDEKLLYVSAIILGLNDALVELSGALAGYTLAIQSTKAIGVIGLITGIAASLSMAIAEYLSIKEDSNAQLNYNKAATYTGITYLFTVLLLVFPYFVIQNKHIALSLMVGIDIFLVFIFNYYISVTTGANLMKKFLRMTGIVLSVAIISFMVGYFVQDAFKVNI